MLSVINESVITTIFRDKINILESNIYYTKILDITV